MKAHARLSALVLGGIVAVGLSGPLVVQGAPQSGGNPRAWLLPANSYSGNRYVTMSQIGPSTVSRLRRAWKFRISDDSPIETSPIVSNGTIYITSAHDHVYAINARTGTLKWEFKDNPHVIAFAANRGVALINGKVYVGTLDGRLVALDAATGRKIFSVLTVHDPVNSFYTMQPVPYKGMLILGVSNGDWGGIGNIAAFDPSNGRRIWEWKTIPGPGEPGHNTWTGDSWKRGGGAIWSGIAIDPKTSTLYADLGNPQPDFYGDDRKGSNLYTNSMVALDISGSTPKLKWYHQFIPHDTHDWDPAMPPVRFTGMVNGAPRQLVAAGDKGGNFWILDANTGKLVVHKAVSSQKGQNTEPSRAGNIACPNTNGGVEYNGGAYDPMTNAFYVPSVNECGLWKKLPRATYIGGLFYLGGTFPKLVGPNTGWMQAINVSTGTFMWRKKQRLPAVGGALATSTGLVFSGMTTGDFDAFNAKTGAVMWQDHTGSPILAPPVSYMVGGKQYVAVASGQAGNQQVPEMAQHSAAGSFLTVYTLQ